MSTIIPHHPTQLFGASGVNPYGSPYLHGRRLNAYRPLRSRSKSLRPDIALHEVEETAATYKDPNKAWQRKKRRMERSRRALAFGDS